MDTYCKYRIELSFVQNYNILSKNDWELHKKYVKEGVNPNEIAKIIRNDEIEKLQEISSQTNFDFNQTIEPSLYERCSFVNKENVSLIDFAAFFSAIKCFKYLLMNGAKVKNTGKYAVAGGNEEIIHICEQNHSSFKGAYETAIQFHRSDVFHYIYENELEITNGENLEEVCIFYQSYEILTFLVEKFGITEKNLQYFLNANNIYLMKHICKNNLPYAALFKLLKSGAYIELIQYALKQNSVNINERMIYLFYFKFILIIFYFNLIFGKHLKYLKQHLCMHLRKVTQI